MATFFCRSSSSSSHSSFILPEAALLHLRWKRRSDYWAKGEEKTGNLKGEGAREDSPRFCRILMLLLLLLVDEVVMMEGRLDQTPPKCVGLVRPHSRATRNEHIGD